MDASIPAFRYRIVVKVSWLTDNTLEKLVTSELITALNKLA